MLATVIRAEGEPPSRPGAKALFGRHGPLSGTLGCSEFDAAALSDAPALLDSGSPQLRTYRHDLGAIEVYLEPHQLRPTLLVMAATPVASILLRWAPDLGFRTLLYESRIDRLSDAVWRSAEVIRSPAALADLSGELYAVHTDHDAADLVEVLRSILPRRPRFLGLMGSRRHTGHHLEALRAGGFSESDLALIQTPVGIDIGARSAPEIALSILAAAVATRRGGSTGWMDPQRVS
jgi:xanthine dehydrogenase accessory factor